MRFAVLDCEDAVKWDGHAIALSRLLSRAGERWCAPPSRATRPGFLLAPRRPRANTRDGSSSPVAFAFASPPPSLTLRVRLRREHFRCWNDERPAVVDLPTYAGLVVTGSHHGCNDAHAWIGNLRAFLRHVVEEHPRVRILATCFGHQLLAQALGGAAGPNPGGAFVLRRESLECEDAMLERDDFRAAAAMFPPASGAPPRDSDESASSNPTATA